VDSWSWDSNTIFFYSSRYNNFAEYKVNRTGGTPSRLFGDNYFNTVIGAVEHPVTKAYYFTDTMESEAFALRKRYKGDNNPDIKSYNPETKVFKQHTTYRGKDMWPSIDKNGNVYFVSDRDNGEYNLYKLEGDNEVSLTSMETSAIKPQVSANGEKLVFARDFQVYTYDVKEKKIAKLDIRLFRNDVLKTEQAFNINGKITSFDVSPDGKKFAFISRGEIFVSDIKGKFIKKLNIAPETRALEVKWLNDNKTLLYTRTNANGWTNIFKMTANVQGKEEQLTNDDANNRNLFFDSGKTQVIYLSGTTQLKLMDLKTNQSRVLVTDEIWGFYNSQPYFSPDDNYVVFTVYRNFEQDIIVIDLKTNKVTNLTESGISEIDPFWSPDGKYIYFSCNRYMPNYPRGGADAKIYRMPLNKYLTPFKSDELDNLFKEEEKKEATPSKDSKDKAKPAVIPEKKPGITFNMDELTARWEQISPDTGTQVNPVVFSQKEVTTILYLSNHDEEGKFNIWKTTMKPFEAPKTQKIEGAETDNLDIRAVSDNYYALVNGSIVTLDLGGNKATPVAMNFSFSRNLEEEFNQMFNELWAGLQENFYDENFHGKDWSKIRDAYRQYLPLVRTRADFRILVNMMLGELNSSHQGFRSNGEEEKSYYNFFTMETGILFDNLDPYKVKSLVKDSPVDKMEIDIQPGDILVEVNGKKVDSTANRDIYFTNPSAETELSMVFKRKQNNLDKMITVKVHPINARTLREELYDDWVRDNQKRVDEKSGKKIAYIHMKDMGETELNNFLIEMSTEWYNREALILDIRNNNGGNVHGPVLSLLSQKPYMVWKFRGGKYTPQPSFSPSEKPIILLINENSLSDAELTATGFKQLQLGKIIGSETYRWLIFTSGRVLVDGSFYRLPSWGCYSLDKKNIETEGVKPDIYIKNSFMDKETGNDPQLDTAIAEIMKQLKK